MNKSKQGTKTKKVVKLVKPSKTKKAAAIKSLPKALPKAQVAAKEGTIGNFTKLCILSHMTVKEIEKAIKEKFPKAKPQTNSIYYYRSQLHKSGELAK